MTTVNYSCLHCQKEAKKGEKIIIINSLVAYHPNCYRLDRERVWGNFTLIRNDTLNDASERNASFLALTNPNSLKESDTFTKLWNSQTLVIEELNLIAGKAARLGAISWLDEMLLRRRINRVENRVKEIHELYKNEWRPISFKIKDKQVEIVDDDFPRPSIDDLKQAEKSCLQNIASNVQEVIKMSTELIAECRQISEKMTEKENKRMNKQIEEMSKSIQAVT